MIVKRQDCGPVGETPDINSSNRHTIVFQTHMEQLILIDKSYLEDA